ncbi:MAG: SBBP repeat-containing protein [Candidatus Aminicenantales bacterium]
MGKRVLAGTFLIACISFLTPGNGIPAVAGRISHPPSALANRILQVQPHFGDMPVVLIPNMGQLDGEVDYYIQGKDKAIYFGANGVTFALAGADEKKAAGIPESGEPGKRIPPDRMNALAPLTDRRPGEASRWVVKLDFVDAAPAVKPVGTDKTGTVISYFQGERGNWKTGLSPYSRIVYANLWPGIDLVYSGTMDKLKYEFIVHPGADPSRIRLTYRGASSVAINDAGRLAVSTPAGGFEDGVPVAYQENSGNRMNVPLAYKILDHAVGSADHDTAGENEGAAVTYGFSVGSYDRTRTLVLDPMILIYCGYIGGPSYDYGYGIAADKDGCAYVTGYTYSTAPGFPAKVGPDRTFNGGNTDVFVAKLTADGTALNYCGYIGGSGDDYGYGIAVDASGNAYVTGYTNSTQRTFPVAKGPSLIHSGNYDAFVAKVNAGGTALDYCGYIGGALQDYGRGIAVDASGNAYITGYTNSTESTFPVVGGPSLIHGGNFDAFVAKVNADGTALDYCGYIGGALQDYGRGIAVDTSGNAYITGYTNSTESTFPVSGGSDITENGGFDAFVAKVDPQGASLVYCGYIGGSGEDVGTAIAVDPSGCAYVTGYTDDSSASSFPVSGGPDLVYNGGFYDAFVAKVRAEGYSLLYCGYIGGLGYDVGTGIAVDGRGYAFVTGYTSSAEGTFPVKGGPSLTLSGSYDAFVAKVDITGASLEFCGYVGGSNSDLGMGIALDTDGSGNIYLTGNTYSTETTFPVTSGPDLTYNGNRDAFVAKINEISVDVTSPNGGESWHVGFTENITWLTSGKVGNVKIEYSPDDGTTWTEIVSSTENDGTYAWFVPEEAVSTSGLIRVSEAETGDPSDTSDAVFTVSDAPIIVVTSPNGGESWTVGSTQNITWISMGVDTNVKIEYSTDAGTTWVEIVASTENYGTYEWIVPDAVSDICLVQISEADTGSPTDMSDSIFSITAASSPRAAAPTIGTNRSAAPPKVIKRLKSDKTADPT